MNEQIEMMKILNEQIVESEKALLRLEREMHLKFKNSKEEFMLNPPEDVVDLQVKIDLEKSNVAYLIRSFNIENQYLNWSLSITKK